MKANLNLSICNELDRLLRTLFFNVVKLFLLLMVMSQYINHETLRNSMDLSHLNKADTFSLRRIHFQFNSLCGALIWTIEKDWGDQYTKIVRRGCQTMLL